ncbi:MAG: YceI family protein, partial [Rickettsiales bacterium]
VLSLGRLVWRWLNKPPPFAEGMATWERVAAKATHWMFYFLMIGIPLSGWLYVSTQWHDDSPLNVSTSWFGLFTVPHLFDLDQLPDAQRQQWSAELGETHEWLAFSALFLLALHVAAALKHHFINRDETLGQMLPVFAATPTPRGRRIPLWLGSILIAIALIASLVELFSVERAATQAQGQITSSGSWAIDPQASEIAFSGKHAGKAFRGRFGSWHAELQLNPDAPQESTIRVEASTASAKNGIKLHDKSLPEAEWFDVANHPQAVFHLTGLSAVGEGQYAALGTLSIKDRKLELPAFTLQLDNERARFKGKVRIDRADVDMGMESDPRGEWVSREIVIEVDAVAYPVE